MIKYSRCCIRLSSHPSRYTDTAVVYRNEQHIGVALQTLLPKYSLQRKDVFITSKLSKYAPPESTGHETAMFLGTFSAVVVVLGGLVRERRHESDLHDHKSNPHLLHRHHKASLLHLLHVTSLVVSVLAFDFSADFSHSAPCLCIEFSVFSHNPC